MAATTTFNISSTRCICALSASTLFPNSATDTSSDAIRVDAPDTSPSPRDASAARWATGLDACGNSGAFQTAPSHFSFCAEQRAQAPGTRGVRSTRRTRHKCPRLRHRTHYMGAFSTKTSKRRSTHRDMCLGSVNDTIFGRRRRLARPAGLGLALVFVLAARPARHVLARTTRRRLHTSALTGPSRIVVVGGDA